jgi:hypothetical protein
MGMLWHYVQNGKSLGPVPEEQLKALLSSGALRPTDLVWHEGMASWTAIQGIPELQPPTAPLAVAPQPNLYAAPQANVNPPAQAMPQATGLVSDEAVDLLRKTKPWVRFFSILGIIGILLMALGAVAMVLMSFGPFQAMPVIARIGIGALYLVLALLYVPPVVFLHRYASRIRELVDEHSFLNLEQALRAQKSFWKYIGMFMVITMCVYVLVLIGVLVTSLVMGLGRHM